ncbi:hypothetical protein CDL12_04440 [Handroanthus impetiginosus]|uniref:Uncharacterized protein n=1 Tax=Handroanthus impetiginosus TaxID=429701 RepID=A0A2G9HZA6_9LAMI|nr:hypothetical protein CDL12_04440 [Handroanthus impetiginosus]
MILRSLTLNFCPVPRWFSLYSSVSWAIIAIRIKINLLPTCKVQRQKKNRLFVNIFCFS